MTLLPLFNTVENVQEKIHAISPTIEVSVIKNMGSAPLNASNSVILS
jgi:hypothetical protein